MSRSEWLTCVVQRCRKEKYQKHKTRPVVYIGWAETEKRYRWVLKAWFANHRVELRENVHPRIAKEPRNSFSVLLICIPVNRAPLSQAQGCLISSAIVINLPVVSDKLNLLNQYHNTWLSCATWIFEYKWKYYKPYLENRVRHWSNDASKAKYTIKPGTHERLPNVIINMAMCSL